MAATAAAVADVANTGVAADELRQFVERIERLEEEKAAIAGDIKEVFAEMKGRGFDTKAVRSILRDPQEGPCRAAGGGGDPRTLHAGARDGLRPTRAATAS